MKNFIKNIFLITILVLPQLVNAHPGRTDSSGCHTCRTNCPSWGLSTGEYHCHRSKGVSQPVEPIKSTYGENGTGYTTPAPEYKEPVVKPVVTPTVEDNPTPTQAKAPANTIQLETKTIEKKSWISRLFSWFK